MRLERSIISSVSQEESENQEIASYKAMPKLDRLGLITYLRESFYGEEATTGRLPRVFEFTQRS